MEKREWLPYAIYCREHSQYSKTHLMSIYFSKTKEMKEKELMLKALVYNEYIV